MLTQALQLANQQAASAQAAHAAAAAASSPSQGAAGSGQAADSPTPMDVDTGLRSRRAESYIPTLPQLNYAGMTTRHAEIKVWTSYREELTSWLCLLDDRYATELAEAETSTVEILQATLDVGKAARSTKLWFLLRQSLAKFQRAQDIIHLVEIQQKGASAGYEFWRLLNAELSVRSRVEGQAMREQTLNLAPPKHLKRPLDIMRWFTTELLRFEAQISNRFPELKITEQEAVLHVLKFLDEDAKRYLLLHQTTSGLQPMMRGLQFYDEQLRVLNFQKEHHGFASAFGSGKDGRGKDSKGKDGKGKKGEKGKDGKGKSSGKSGKGDGKPKTGKGSSNREPSKAKKTDVCRNCGKKGHWARDCWRPAKQASAVQEQTDSGVSSGSQVQAPNPKATAIQPTTKGDVGKGERQSQQKGVRTFLEGSYFAMSNFAVDSFAMPAVSASGVKHEEGVFWLLDSGSSYHVISRETLDCGHVKVLSRRQKPRTVCQTATGDLVEVGSDMRATVEVSFLTTHPISANGGHRQDVLSNYACTCRLEAVVSDQIKHNLINLNLLCWKGWKPTLHKGLLTAEQHGVVLLPHLYGDCTWLESVAPEHPSALYAGELMSSVVGQSVGRSVAGLVGRPEKRVSFQSDSDVPKEEEVFPESFQDLQPQHVFGRHVHDHDVLADYVEHVVDLRLVGQVDSQLGNMSELQEQTMLARQSVSSDEERYVVGQGQEVPPQEESEDEPQITGVRTVGLTVWTIPSGVPLTVRREVESWTMETATMPTTPSFFQRMERGLSPAAAMITLHRDLTLRLEGHMAWQAPYFIRMVDDPETMHRKPEYWYRCKVCQKWLDVAHLQGQTHSTNMQAYMQEGNPHLTAEHPLEAIPRNYREACIEGYTDLGLHRIADEFRRIVEAERRRTEPKAKSRPKSPQAKARPAEPKKAKAKSRPKSPQAKARPAESKKARAPATAKKTKASATATVEKAEAPEPPVKRAPEAFRRSGVWLEENPPPEPAAEVGPAAARPDSAAPNESWGAWRPPPAPTPPEVAPTTTPPLKKPRIPWAPREPVKEGPIVRRPHGESYHTKMASQPYMAHIYYQEIQAATQAQQQQRGQASQARAIPAPPPPPPPSASSSSRGPRPSAAPPAPVAPPLKPAPAVPKPTQAWQYNIPEPPPVPRSSRSDSRDP